jgi:hypothetical protein
MDLININKCSSSATGCYNTRYQLDEDNFRIGGFRLTQLCFNGCLLFYSNYPLHVWVVRPCSSYVVLDGNPWTWCNRMQTPKFKKTTSFQIMSNFSLTNSSDSSRCAMFDTGSVVKWITTKANRCSLCHAKYLTGCSNADFGINVKYFV